jgi:hypothetical protein
MAHRHVTGFIAIIGAGALVLGASACSSSDSDSDPSALPESTPSLLQLASSPPGCQIKCIAPPDGCSYKGARLSGPCNSVTCGRLVCDRTPQCSLSCAAPPDGCHYEGALTTGDCDAVTCGTLVCDGSTL